jgi:hypothetical protein
MTKLWDLPHGIPMGTQNPSLHTNLSHPPWTAWMHTNATIHKLSPALKETLIALNHLRHSSTRGMKQIMIFECNQLQDFFYELRLHSSLYYNQRQLKDHLKYNSHPLACKQHNLSWLKNPNCSQEFDLYKSIWPENQIHAGNYHFLVFKSLYLALHATTLRVSGVQQSLPISSLSMIHPAITRLPAFANDRYYASQFSIRTCGCVWVPFECWICGADFRAFAAPPAVPGASMVCKSTIFIGVSGETWRPRVAPCC